MSYTELGQKEGKLTLKVCMKHRWKQLVAVKINLNTALTRNVWLTYILVIHGLIKLCHIYAAAAKSLQSCLILCDPIDGSPPGSPIPGILQVRTLEWVAISFSSHIYSNVHKC